MKASAALRFIFPPLVLLLPACGYLRLDPQLAKAQQDIAETLDRLAADQPVPRPVSTFAGNWISNSAIKIAQPVPEALQQEINLSTTEPHTLDEIAARIAWKTGIPVRIDPELRAAPDDPGAVDAPPGAGFLLPALTYRHSGTIGSFLDDISARLGIAWRYEDRQLHLARFISKVFTVYLLPGTAQFDATVGGQASAREVAVAGADAGAAPVTSDGSRDEVRQTTDISSHLDRWGELIHSVGSLLSLSGRMSASPSTGTLLVTDTPSAVRRVERFITHMNAQLLRQIALSVHIFSVRVEEGAEAGIDWSLVFDNDHFSTRLLSPSTGSDIASLSLGLVDMVRGGNGQLRPASSDFAGTEAIVKALNSLSNVSTVTSANLVTLNNQPAPVQVTRSIGYLRSISNVVTGTAGVSETTLEPGRVTSGFVMTVTPRILENDRILIRFAADLSSLLGFASQSSSGASIQTPETDERAFLQEVVMRSGQSLVLSGFEQVSNERGKEGLGDTDNWLASAHRLGRARTRILIVISPTLIGDQHGPA